MNLKAELAALRERNQLAERLYEALKATRRLREHRMVSFRCRRNCLLADVVATPQGTLVHQPAYKLSKGRSDAQSSPAGRAKNSADDGRHWYARSYFLDDAFDIGVQCDHLLLTLLTRAEIEADAQRRVAEVTMPRD